jgi:acyl-CoA thioester hydrolase
MTLIVAPQDAALQAGVEVWRGGVNTWECDEMGHMNVRFYVARSIEALTGLAAELGMPHAFSPDASATLRVREQHIRFLREVRPPNPLHMIGAVVEMGETDARLLLTLVHSLTGTPAASFQIVVSHVTPGEGRAFPWPRAVRARALALTSAIPAYAAARSVSLAPVTIAASPALADELGLATISAGAIGARECDAFGRMSGEGFIGRISDGVGRLVSDVRAAIAGAAPTPPGRIGAAALEYRLAHLDWPRAGDRQVIRSGLIAIDQRIVTVAHWMLDPASGRPWGLAEAVIAALDLDSRKIVPIAPAAQAALAQKIAVEATLVTRG